MTFKDIRNLNRHVKTTCNPEAEPHLTHTDVDKIFRAQKTLLEQLEDLGLTIAKQHQFHVFFAAVGSIFFDLFDCQFDIECYCTSKLPLEKGDIGGDMPGGNKVVEVQKCSFLWEPFTLSLPTPNVYTCFVQAPWLALPQMCQILR